MQIASVTVVIKIVTYYLFMSIFCIDLGFKQLNLTLGFEEFRNYDGLVWDTKVQVGHLCSHHNVGYKTYPDMATMAV